MADRLSSAHVFYDSIMSSPDPAAAIESLINQNDPTFEGEWLEFKSPYSAGECDPELDRKIKEKWSEALSGFANTGGGVLIWGIKADGKKGDIDCAKEAVRIPEPAKMKSRLLQLHHQSTVPPVANVEVEAVPPMGPGFVICLIPQSDFGPHRADHVKNTPYYIRAGDDFIIPDHSLLRMLFSPKLSSYLWLEVAAAWNELKAPETGRAVAPRVMTVDYVVRLHNRGPATARELFIVVQAPCNTQPEPGWVKCGNPQGLGLRSEWPLHPGSVVKLCVARQECGAMIQASASEKLFIPKLDSPAAFRFLMYAGDREPLEASVHFNQEDVQKRAIKKGLPQVGTWHIGGEPT